MKEQRSHTNFNKHASLIVREEQPFNAGSPPELILKNYVTPSDLFFVRNHAAVPEVDASVYRLTIDGMTRRPLTLSLDELRGGFRKRTITATLQCAGNRRSELAALEAIPGEVAWGTEAISNGVWSGVALREVLERAGVEAAAQHVAFTALDEVERNGQRFGFGGSIPIDKAMSDQTLLAYEMNAESLPPVHGFPLRVIVPGYIGARSVKWLERITLQREPSTNYFQAHAYKLFPPQTRAETARWESGLMLGEQSLNAVICAPLEGETFKIGDHVTVKGWAVAGGGRSIERVDVSIDGGATWFTASFTEGNDVWAWRFWETEIELTTKHNEIVARAWDSAANTQPEDARKIWNFKGYMNNAWHRIRVQAEQ